MEYVATEGTRAAPTTTSGTDEELREAFEAVEQEKELEELEEVAEGPQEKAKTVEEEVNLWSSSHFCLLFLLSSDFCLFVRGNSC